MGFLKSLGKSLAKATGLDKIASGISKSFKIFNPKKIFDGVRGLNDKVRDKAKESLEDLRKSGKLQDAFKGMTKVAFPGADKLLDRSTVSTVNSFLGKASGTTQLADMAKTVGDKVRAYVKDESVSDEVKSNVARNVGQMFAKSQANLHMQQQ